MDMSRVMIVFRYSITVGVAMGCISLVLVKTLSGRGKEVNRIMQAVAPASVGLYAFLRERS